MTGFSRLSYKHLLIENLSWYCRTGSTETAGTLEQTEVFAAPATLHCLSSNPDARWMKAFPDADFTNAIQFCVPWNSGVARRDKITFRGRTYRVEAVADWGGAGYYVLCFGIEGVTS